MATFDELCGMLRADDTLTRIEAAEALGGLGDPRAVEALTAALVDPDFKVALAAAEALGNYHDPQAAGPLVEALNREDIKGIERALEIANAVVLALQQLGEPGFQGLLRVVQEHADEEFAGGGAVRALGEIGDWRAVKTLFLALHSPSFEVVEGAATALYSLGEMTLPFFVAALLSPDSDTRHWARMTLPKFGASAIPPLLAALHTSSRAYVRQEAASVLAYCDEDERILPALHAALEDADEQVRDAATLALAELGDESVIDDLLDMPSDFDRHGRYSPLVHALTEFGPPILLPMIRALQNRGRPPCARYRAAFVLWTLRDHQAVPSLISALHDPHPGVQAAATQALGALGDERALPALLEVTRDEQHAARASAISSLGAFERHDVIELLARVIADTEQDRDVRIAAANALRGMGESALPILRSIVLGTSRDELLLRTIAFSILAGLGRLGIDVLIEAARRGEMNTRLSAYAQIDLGLRTTRDPRITAFLIDALDQERSLRLRHHIAFMLGRLGEPRAVPGLLDALHSPHLLMRAEAARYLGDLSDISAVPLLRAAYDATVHAETNGRRTAVGVREEALDTFLDAIRRIEARAAGEKSEMPSAGNGDHQ